MSSAAMSPLTAPADDGMTHAPADASNAWASRPDYTKVTEKANKVSGNFYTINGEGPDFFPAPNCRPIATIGMLPGPDGIFLRTADRKRFDYVLRGVREDSLSLALSSDNDGLLEIGRAHV